MRPSGRAAWGDRVLSFLAKLFEQEPTTSGPRPASAATGKVAPARPKTEPTRPATTERRAQPPLTLEELVGAPAEPRPPLADAELNEIMQVAAAVVSRFRQDAENLPAFPGLAHRILRAIDQPEFDVGELVKLINQDPGISGQVLKLANSALYSRGEDVGSLRDAVLRLGSREVANVAVAASSRTLFDAETRAAQARFRAAWLRRWLLATGTAFGASWFAMLIHRGRSEQTFLGGMFIDIGKTFALRSLGALVVAEEIRADLPDHLVEAVLEEVHVELGAKACELWQLPEYLVAIITAHHFDELPAEPELESLHILRVIAGINELRINPSYTGDPLRQVRQSFAALGLDLFQLRALATELKSIDQKVALM